LLPWFIIYITELSAAIKIMLFQDGRDRNDLLPTVSTARKNFSLSVLDRIALTC